MNPFMNIDHELRDALRRKQAPADLAERVLARINELPAVRQAAPASIRLRQGYGGQGVRRWLAARRRRWRRRTVLHAAAGRRGRARAAGTSNRAADHERYACGRAEQAFAAG